MTKTATKTHYRKAFNSPYLSSADLIGPIELTIKHVLLEPDHSHKSQENFNTAYFVEKEIRTGEELKPMILNAGNSLLVRKFTDSPYIEDWNKVAVTIYVEKDVKMGRDLRDGLRISSEQPTNKKREISPADKTIWAQAIASYKREGNFDQVLRHAHISDKNKKILIQEAKEGE